MTDDKKAQELITAVWENLMSTPEMQEFMTEGYELIAMGIPVRAKVKWSEDKKTIICTHERISDD